MPQRESDLVLLTRKVSFMPAWPLPSDYPDEDYVTVVLPRHRRAMEEWEKSPLSDYSAYGENT